MPKYRPDRTPNLVYVHESGRRQQVTLRTILMSAGEVMGVMSSMITNSSNRTLDVTRARQLVATALRRRCLNGEGFPLSWREIGKLMKIDHRAAMKLVESLVEHVNPKSDRYDPEAIDQWKDLHVCIGAYAVKIDTAEINALLGNKSHVQIQN